MWIYCTYDWITNTRCNGRTWTEFNLWKYFEMSTQHGIVHHATTETMRKRRNRRKKWRESNKNSSRTEFMIVYVMYLWWIYLLISEVHRFQRWQGWSRWYFQKFSIQSLINSIILVFIMSFWPCAILVGNFCSTPSTRIQIQREICYVTILIFRIYSFSCFSTKLQKEAIKLIFIYSLFRSTHDLPLIETCFCFVYKTFSFTEPKKMRCFEMQSH